MSGNRTANNSFGATIDAGFPFRSGPRLWTATFGITFSGNTVFGNRNAPALITFTRNTAALGIEGENLKKFKYLQDSVIDLSTRGELDGYWFDHPAIDPIDGRVLNNTLIVNGVTIPNGRNFK